MTDIEGGTWGNIFLGLSTIGLGLGWARDKWLKNRVDTANTGVAESAAGGMELVIKSLTDRLGSLETEMQSVRAELAVERKHSRKLELHIFRLESLMRKSGLEPPVYEEIQ